MRSTGIVRRIDNLGRVVIPNETRKHLGIKKGDPLEVFIHKDEIILRKYDISIGLIELVNKMKDEFLEVKKGIDEDTANIIYEHINALHDILKDINSC